MKHEDAQGTRMSADTTGDVIARIHIIFIISCSLHQVPK